MVHCHRNVDIFIITFTDNPKLWRSGLLYPYLLSAVTVTVSAPNARWNAIETSGSPSWRQLHPMDEYPAAAAVGAAMRQRSRSLPQQQEEKSVGTSVSVSESVNVSVCGCMSPRMLTRRRAKTGAKNSQESDVQSAPVHHYC